MIVCRILAGDGKVGEGSCKIKGYDDGYWFPVESFNFGFEDSEDKMKEDAPAGGAPGGPKAAPAPRSSSGQGKGGGGKGDKGKKDFTEVTLQKDVDSTTCYLMLLSMEERQTKGKSKETERNLKADIHVLASVQVGDTKEKYTYAAVLLHLEAVNLKGWNINGSGDGRPKETVKLRYDRAAMIYCATKDGKTFITHGPKGWDQTKNMDFLAAKTFNWPKDGKLGYDQYLPANQFITHRL